MPVSIIIVNMLVGYNTNVSYKGTVYHVQTEDSGIRNPHIITLLYDKGTILASKKISYADIVTAPDYKEQVRELMKNQHKAMIKELISGKYRSDQALPQTTEGTIAETPALSASAASQASPASPAAEETSPEPPQEPQKQISKSLDDILLDYILKEEEK
jgi:hypothetical protein